jgi:hypothetical protein
MTMLESIHLFTLFTYLYSVIKVLKYFFFQHFPVLQNQNNNIEDYVYKEQKMTWVVDM